LRGEPGVSIEGGKSYIHLNLGEGKMRLNTIGFGAVVGVFALAISGYSSANGAYVGASFGQSSSGDYEDYVAFNYDDGSIYFADVEDKSFSYRIFVGTDLNENFSAELGYVNFGEATTAALSNGCCVYAAGFVDHELSADGIDFSVVGKVLVGQKGSVNARAGFLKWDAEERISDSTGWLKGSDDGSDAFFAFGGEYKATDGLGIRGEYAFYKLGDFDVDVLSLSILYYFGAK